MILTVIIIVLFGKPKLNVYQNFHFFHKYLYGVTLLKKNEVSLQKIIHVEKCDVYVQKINRDTRAVGC